MPIKLIHIKGILISQRNAALITEDYNRKEYFRIDKSIISLIINQFSSDCIDLI